MNQPTEVIVYSPITYLIMQSLPNFLCGFALMLIAIKVLDKFMNNSVKGRKIFNNIVTYVAITVFLIGFIAPEHIRF